MTPEERKRAEEMAKRISENRKNLISDEIKKQILEFLEKDLLRNECSYLYYCPAWKKQNWYFSRECIEVPQCMMTATIDWLRGLGVFHITPSYHPISYNQDGYKVYLKK